MLSGSNGYVDTKAIGKLEDSSGTPGAMGRSRRGRRPLELRPGRAHMKMDGALKTTGAVDGSALHKDAQATSTVVYNALARRSAAARR